jgi:hypothetical protein
VKRMSALGHKRTCAAHKLMSALGPIADIAAKSKKKKANGAAAYAARVMSALPLKADIQKRDA